MVEIHNTRTLPKRRHNNESMMRRFLLVISIILGQATPVLAQQDPLVTPNEVQAAVMAQDFDQVEQLLDRAQDNVLRGDATLEGMRALFSVFDSTHPDVIAFSAKWVARHPSSPYANVARAQVLFEAGALIRGERTAEHTYADALRLHSQLHREAWTYATAAYDAAPRLIGASDMVIKLANTTHNKARAFAVLDEVMKADPNMGSLTRALHMAHKGWGGSFAQAERICAAFAPNLDYGVDPLTHCRLVIWKHLYRDELDEWAATIMPAIKDPYDDHLAPYRVKFILETQAEDRAEDAKFLYDYLTRPYVLAPEEAAAFDTRFAVPYGYDFQNETHLSGAKRRAWHMLEADPYNRDHLITMITEEYHLSIEYEGDITRIMAEPVGPLKHDIHVDMLKRLLKVSPYDPINWHRFADVAFGTRTMAASLRRDPYEINSIAYSNQGAWEIENHLNNKMGQFIRLEKFNTGEHNEDWREVLTDLDGQVLCPLIRVYRMRQFKCKEVDPDEDKFCYPNAEAAEWYAKALSDAVERSVCKWERMTPVQTLSYTPVDVDFEGDLGG